MPTLTEAPAVPVALNNDEILRYSRHLIMPEVGMEGQLKLKAAKVLCIGAGGLGVFIFRGLAAVDSLLLLVGAIPAAIMALTADRVLEWVAQALSQH